MLSKEHTQDWVLLVAIGLLLFYLYNFSLKEMFKQILTWGFALIGYKLFIESNKEKIRFGNE